MLGQCAGYSCAFVAPVSSDELCSIRRRVSGGGRLGPVADELCGRGRPRARRRRGLSVVVACTTIRDEEGVVRKRGQQKSETDEGNGVVHERGVEEPGQGRAKGQFDETEMRDHGEERGPKSEGKRKGNGHGKGSRNGNGDQNEAGKKGQVEWVKLLQIGGRELRVKGRWLLYLVPFFWGSFGPGVRLLFSQDAAPHPSIFNTERLLLAMLVYTPVLYGELSVFTQDRKLAKEGIITETAQENDRYSFVRAGIELGFWVFLANVFQVVGLKQTSASRAAFFNQLQTVFVPMVAWILGLNKVTRSTLLASGIAVLGVALLSFDKSHGTSASLTGDALEIISALFFSGYIIRLGEYANRIRSSPLVATKIAVQAALSIAWVTGMELMTSAAHHHALSGPVQATAQADDAPVAEMTAAGIVINIAVVLWTGLLSSAVSGWAQTKGQQSVPASEAAVIFATQPLWASGIAAVLLGEGFGPKGIAGGALIVLSTLVASRQKKKSE